MKRKRATTAANLEAVARAAGVSAMTASRALRGAGRVSAETTARVRAAAEELGYRPNPLVQALMAGIRDRRRELGAGIAWVTAFSAGQRPVVVDPIEAGARARAEALGYTLDVVRLDPERRDAAAWARAFRSRRIQGVVVAPLPKNLRTLDLPWGEFAFAAVGRSLETPAVHHVMQHNHHAMERVMAEVVARGFRRVAFLSSRDMDRRAENAARMVFEFVGRQAGRRLRTAWANYDGWEREDALAWLARERPEVVVGEFAAVARRLAWWGVKVPGDLSFVSLSVHDERPEQTGIRHRFDGLGAAAVDLVVAQLHRNERGVPPFAKAVLIEGEWHEGDTLGRRSGGRLVM